MREVRRVPRGVQVEYVRHARVKVEVARGARYSAGHAETGPASPLPLPLPLRPPQMTTENMRGFFYSAWAHTYEIFLATPKSRDERKGKYG
jgi:hypothetical protein